MIGNLTDERVLYRTRKTVLEMLRDRGYEISEAELEETYEEFEQRYLARPQLNFIAKRVKLDRALVGDDEDGAGGEPMMEPIYVVFANKEEKLGRDSIGKVVAFCDEYSKEKSTANTSQLLNVIIIVKGGATPIAKKVS